MSVSDVKSYVIGSQ